MRWTTAISAAVLSFGTVVFGATLTVYTITVPATSPWVDSGLSVSGGETLCVAASGTWKADPAQPLNGPMGRAEACDPASSGCPLHANHASLVARVGTNAPFLVGNGFRFPVNGTWSGSVQFMINDDIGILGDNSGSMAVLVAKGNAACRALARRAGETP
jgi:hypothetical protein